MAPLDETNTEPETATKTATAPKAAKKTTRKKAVKKTAPKTAKKKLASRKTAVGKITSGKSPVAPGSTMTEALGESFLTDLISDWQLNGAGVIETCRVTKPDAYLKLVATYAPKEFRKTIEPFEGMSDDALRKRLAELLEGLGPLGSNHGAGSGR